MNQLIIATVILAVVAHGAPSSSPMENTDNTQFVKWCVKSGYTGSVGQVTKFYIKEESVDDFKRFMARHVAHSVREPGSINFELHADYLDNTIFWVTEAWESPLDILQHMNTEWFRSSFLKAVPGFLADNLQIGFYKLKVDN